MPKPIQNLSSDYKLSKEAEELLKRVESYEAKSNKTETTNVKLQGQDKGLNRSTIFDAPQDIQQRLSATKSRETTTQTTAESKTQHSLTIDPFASIGKREGTQPYQLFDNQGSSKSVNGSKNLWAKSGIVQPYEINPYGGQAVLPYSMSELEKSKVTLQNDGRFLLGIKPSKLKSIDGARDFSVENLKEIPQERSNPDNYRILDSDGMNQARASMGKYYNVHAGKLPTWTPEGKAELDRRNAQMSALKIVALSNGDLSYKDYMALRNDIIQGRGNVYSYDISKFIETKRGQKADILAEQRSRANALLSEARAHQTAREIESGKSDYSSDLSSGISRVGMNEKADAHKFVQKQMSHSLDRLDIIEKKLRGTNSWVDNFFEGVGESLLKEFETPQGDSEGISYIRSIISKYNKGEKINKEDAALLDAYAYSNTIDLEVIKQIPSSYKVGETTGASIPFMLDFITANAVAGVGKVGAKVGGKLTQKALQAMVRNGLLDSSRGLTRFGAKLLGGAARVATDIGVAGAMTAAKPNRWIAGANEMTREKPISVIGVDGKPIYNGISMAPEETNKTKALAKAFTDQWIENASEMSGAWLGGIGSAVKGVGRKLLGEVAEKAPQMMAKYGNGSMGGAMSQIFKETAHIGEKAGFHGIIEENLEEYVGNAARVMILGGDHTWDREFSQEQIKETFVGLLPTMLAFGAVGGAAAIHQNAQSAKQLKEYDDILKAKGVDTDKAKEQMSRMSFNEFVNREAELFSRARLKYTEADIANSEGHSSVANKLLEDAKTLEEKALFALHFARYQGIRGVNEEALNEAREAKTREVSRRVDEATKGVSHLLSQGASVDNTANPTAGTYSRVEYNGNEYTVRNGKYKATAQRDQETGAPIKNKDNIVYSIEADDIVYLQDAEGRIIPALSSDIKPQGETIRIDGLKKSATTILMSDQSGKFNPSSIINEQTLRDASDPERNLAYVQAEPTIINSSEEIAEAEAELAAINGETVLHQEFEFGGENGFIGDSERFVLEEDIHPSDSGKLDSSRPFAISDRVLFDSNGSGNIMSGVISAISDDAYYISMDDGGMTIVPLDQEIWHEDNRAQESAQSEDNTPAQGNAPTSVPQHAVVSSDSAKPQGVPDFGINGGVVLSNQEQQQKTNATSDTEVSQTEGGTQSTSEASEPTTVQEWIAFFDGDIEAALNWLESKLSELNKKLNKAQNNGKKVLMGESLQKYRERLINTKILISNLSDKIDQVQSIIDELKSILEGNTQENVSTDTDKETSEETTQEIAIQEGKTPDKEDQEAAEVPTEDDDYLDSEEDAPRTDDTNEVQEVEEVPTEVEAIDVETEKPSDEKEVAVESVSEDKQVGTAILQNINSSESKDTQGVGNNRSNSSDKFLERILSIPVTKGKWPKSLTPIKAAVEQGKVIEKKEIDRHAGRQHTDHVYLGFDGEDLYLKTGDGRIRVFHGVRNRYYANEVRARINEGIAIWDEDARLAGDCVIELYRKLGLPTGFAVNILRPMSSEKRAAYEERAAQGYTIPEELVEWNEDTEEETEEEVQTDDVEQSEDIEDIEGANDSPEESKVENTAEVATEEEYELTNDEKTFLEKYKEQGEIEDAPEPKRTPRSSVWEFIDKAKRYAILTGVNHRNGFAVGSNSAILLADRTAYKPEYEGKTVDKNGEQVSNNVYPEWNGIIETDSDPKKIDFKKLSAKLRRINTGVSNKKVFSVCVRFPNGNVSIYNSSKLELFCNAAIRLGIEDVCFSRKGHLIAKNDKGVVVVVGLNNKIEDAHCFIDASGKVVEGIEKSDLFVEHKTASEIFDEQIRNSKGSVWDFTTKDGMPAYKGVYYDNGHAVATNGSILLADRTAYKPELNGKIIDKNGKELDSHIKFPKWERVVPNPKEEFVVDFGNIAKQIKTFRSNLENAVKEATNAKVVTKSVKEEVGNSPITFLISDGWKVHFRLLHIEPFVNASVRLGIDRFSLTEDGSIYKLMAHNDKGIVLGVSLEKDSDIDTDRIIDLSSANVVKANFAGIEKANMGAATEEIDYEEANDTDTEEVTESDNATEKEDAVLTNEQGGAEDENVIPPLALAVRDDMLTAMDSGTKPYNGILDLRKRAKGVGMDIETDGKDDIHIQELVELGLVLAARETIKHKGATSKESYDAICRLYGIQPTIGARSGNKIKMQQYSTPLPMGWIAARFVLANNQEAKVLEPTAGNGMFVFAVPEKQVYANELDATRVSMLKQQGLAKVTTQDATMPFDESNSYDGIITNPPFGSRDAVSYDGIDVSGLAPQIAINALDKMADNGRAAIIIGGNTTFESNGIIKDNKGFFAYLYDHYNVRGIFDMDGSMYVKQGTTFPTRMILIDGRRSEDERRNSTIYPPVESRAPRKSNNFDDLYNVVNEIVNSNEKTNGHEVLRSEGGGSKSNSEGKQRTTNREGHPRQHSEDERDRQPRSERGTDGLGESVSRSSVSVLGDGSREVLGTSTTRDGNDPDRGSHGRRGRIHSEDRIQRVEDTLPRLREDKKRTLTEEKLPYRPYSESLSLESVAPAAMVESMDSMLSMIESKHGNIDEFVRSELGYESIKDLHNALAAEQVDSVAMAIYQMTNGKALIIGDQTGVGKGRQMAALIRWAVRNGSKPVFITQKADLFSDIYRDLVDVGSGELVPFIFNSASSSSGRGEMADANGQVVYKSLSEAKKKEIFEMKSIPEGYDYSVLTYSQLSIENKANFLRAISVNNYVFLDESHTAAGDSKTGEFVREMLRDVKGVTFASATFAKRPDSMPIYALRTSISEANVNQEELIEIVKKGGVTLQEIMSRELTNAGQMVRRERDMVGVVTDWKTIDDVELTEKSRAAYNNTIKAFNAIRDFQSEYIEPYIQKKSLEVAAMMKSAKSRKSKDLGVSGTPFASKAYNYTKQLILALKAESIVKEVDAEIKAGRHPVIALESTMESSIKEYAEGEVLENTTFATNLLKGLDSVMTYSLKESGKKKGNPNSILVSDLDPEGRVAYNKLREFIVEQTKDVYVSPIDLIIEGLNKLGYRVGELTGRSTYLERQGDGSAIVKNRTNKDKKKMQRDFNNGLLDVLILNKSASTGISLHSSSKFKDQRQRSMIIAQPLSDINDYMQMMGRIDRTGQVHRGYYINLGLNVPAEARFLMMLSTKLKSLNANTTTSQDSESNNVEAPDILNKYGDRIVIEYLRDHYDVFLKMGVPLKGAGVYISSHKELEEYIPQEGDARKVTGYAALLSVEDQEAFYKDVVSRYNDLISYLNESNSNDLKIAVMPLAAKTLEKKIASVGKDPSGDNPFAQNSYIEKVEMNVLRKPLKATEVQKLINKLNERSIDDLLNIIEKDRVAKQAKESERYQKELVKVKKEIEDYTASINAQKDRDAAEKAEVIQGYKDDKTKSSLEKFNANIERINAVHDVLEMWFGKFEVGKTYLVPDNFEQPKTAGATAGIFCGFKTKKEGLTPSTTFACFATLDGRVRIEVKLSSEIDVLREILNRTNLNWSYVNTVSLDNWDSKIPNETRKNGYIITGNILQSIASTQNDQGGYVGTLISYTDDNGNVHDGVLMPDKWEPNMLRKNAVPLSARLKQIKDKEPITSYDGNVEIIWLGYMGEYLLKVPKSKKEGGKYFLDETLNSLTKRGFYQNRGVFRADISEENIEDVVQRLTELDVKVADERENVSFDRGSSRTRHSIVDQRTISRLIRKLQKSGLAKRIVVDKETFDQKLENVDKARYHKVYHGSPHSFKAFDHSKMGTGEGVQAYGWGTYVTEVDGIAKSYASIANSQTRFVGDKNLYTVDIPNPDEKDENGRWNFYFEWEKEISDEEIDVMFDELRSDFEDDEIFLVRGKGEDVYKSLIDTLGSNELASKFLYHCNYVGISYPAEYQSGGREDKARNYVIFNESDAKIIDHIQFLKDGNQVYGFVTSGVVYLNPELLNTNTPIHEFAHLWNSLIKEQKPDLWHEGVHLIKDSSYMEDVNGNPYYSQLSEEDRLDEALAMAIGDFGAKEIDANGVGGVSLRAWIGKVWDTIRRFLGIPKQSYKNLDDFARMALNDLMGGVRLADGVKNGKYSPSQIKSATDNVGTFDGSNEDIRFRMSDTPLRDYKNACFVRSMSNPDIFGVGASYHVSNEYGLRHIYKDPTVYDEVVAKRKELEAKGEYMDEGWEFWYDPEEFRLKDGYVCCNIADEYMYPEVQGGSAAHDYCVFFDGEEIAEIYDGVVAKVITALDAWHLEENGEFTLVKPSPETNTRLRETESSEDVFRENETAYDALFDIRGIEKKAEEVAGRLGVPVSVAVKSKYELNGAARKAKGYYDLKSGEVVVVLENASSEEDLERTILHEVVGHKGIDALIPKEDREEFFDGVYSLIKEEQLLPIKVKYPNANSRELAEEYIAHLAEGYYEPRFAERMASVIRGLLRKLGFRLKLSNGDVMYLLYKGSVALKRSQSTAAEEIAYYNRENVVRESLKYMDKVDSMGIDELKEEIGEDGVRLAERMDLLSALGERESIRYRSSEEGELETRDLHRSNVSGMMNEKFTSNRKVAGIKVPTKYQFLEETQDDLISLREYKSKVENLIGHELPAYLDIDKVYNQLSSKQASDEETLVKIFEKEIGGAIRKIEKEHKLTYREMQLYVMAKHAIERNQVKRQKAIDSLENPTNGDKARIMQEDYSSEFAISLAVEEVLEDSKSPLLDDVESMRAFIDAIENGAKDDITALWASINKLNNTALKMWYESGMISKDHYDNIKSLYKYYVPLQGIDGETIEDIWTYYGATQGKYSLVKNAEGRGELPDNPFMVMRKSISNTAYISNLNKAKMSVLALAHTHPTDYLIARNSWDILVTDAEGNESWQEVSPEEGKEIVTEESIIDFEERMNALAEDGKARRHKHTPISNIGGYRVSSPNSLEEHMIRVSVNGQEQVVFVNGAPNFAQAVNRENKGKEREFLSKVAWLTRAKASFATSFNIPFAAVNGVRDLIWALSSSGIRYGRAYEARFIRYYGKAAKFLFSADSKHDEDMQKLWDEFVRNGGRTGYMAMIGTKTARKLSQRGLSDDLGRKWKYSRAIKSAEKTMAYIGETVEDLTRFSAYCASRVDGKSVVESINVAKEMTVNFNRRGKASTLAMRSVHSAYMFINANIQGAAQLLKMFKEHPKGTAMMASCYAMIPIISSTLAALISGDDNDYFALSVYERSHNFIIPLGKGKYLKIPAPQEMYPFLAIGNAISELIYGQSSVSEALLSSVDGVLAGATFGLDASTSTLREFSKAIKKGEENPTYLLFRSVMPSVLQPFTDVWNNWDYLGKHIEKPDYGRRTPKYQRVNENRAWDWLVLLSKAINGVGVKGRALQDSSIIGALNSPANVQYLIESWFGGVVSTIAREAQFAEKLLDGDNFFESVSNAAISRRFAHFDSNLEESKKRREFYDAKAEIDNTYKEIEAIKKGIEANEMAIREYEQNGNYAMIGILEKEIVEAEEDIVKASYGKDPELLEIVHDMFKNQSRKQAEYKKALDYTIDDVERSEIQESMYDSYIELLEYYNELVN